MASVSTDRRFGVNSSLAVKAPCRVATTVNITLSGEQTIDGIACVAGDRVLVKNQTTATDNGIWEVYTSAWSRTPDFDDIYDVAEGTLIPVNNGDTNADTIWRVTNTGTITVGVTSLTFESAIINNSNTVSFTQTGSGAVVRTVQAVLRDTVSVKDFGALGDGVADDTAAFVAAVATGNPIFVPYTDDYYAVSALTANQIKALYGPGVVKIAGSLQWISSDPGSMTNDTANQSFINSTFQPSKWASVDGSLRNGAFSAVVTRTGGYGAYGLSLTEYLVNVAIPSGQFDVGQTAWVSATNLTGGGLFGAWFGANTPSSELSQAYSSGNVTGMEVNVGNRWGEIGLQSDIAVTRCTIGITVVPDVLPALDGEISNIFNGTFAQVFAQSIHGHKWWTATLIRADSIEAAGIAHQANGGSTALLAPSTWAKVMQHWGYGIDFESGTFATSTINFPSASSSATATAGGAGALPAGVQGYLVLTIAGGVIKVPYYNS